MRFKMNINAKMLVYILATTVLIFALSVGYISIQTRQLALDEAKKLVKRVASEKAQVIEKDLSEDLSVLRTLAQAFTVYSDMPEEEWKSLFLEMYHKVYENNPDFYKLWDSWELKHFDTTWTKDYGRYAITLYRQNGEVKVSQTLRSLDGDNELYGKIKSMATDMLWEPYWDAFIEESEVKKFMTSISSPIYNNNEFAGIVAADIIMDKFQDIVRKIKPFENTVPFLTSNQGTIVGHQQQQFIGKNIIEYAPEYEEQFELTRLIQEGKPGLFMGENKKGKKALIALAPIEVGKSDTPWALGLIVPVKVVLKDANHSQFISLLVSFFGLLLLSIIIYVIAKNMSLALKKTTHILEKLSKGDIEKVEQLNIKTGDEIEGMAQSVNMLMQGLNKTSVFAEQIGKGDLNADFKPLSEKDALGNALLKMRKSLIHAEEEEKKRKIEDDKLNWATQGLAKFGEILRTNANNIEELSFNIMSNLISYLDVNQGALFVIDDSEGSEDEENKHLELKSAIAYGRDKFIKKRIAVGEELVGRCAFEQKTIYMTDIPQDYIKITSGMGTANPTSLLLVPLVLNDDIFGVIELASFNEIEKYQIDFVEKLGESIASTISTVKINDKTSELLGQSKQQAEELAAQEEEMRQNLEELQATQEEAARREYEMQGVVKALGNTAYIVEYDLDGTILSINDKYAEVLGSTPEQIIGKNHADGYEFSAEMKANYDLFWGDLKRGIPKKETNKVNYNGKLHWVEETYTPISSENEDTPYKILKIGFDITEQRQKEEKLKEQEIKIKKETLVIGEYRDRIKELEQELTAANKKIEKHKNEKPTPEIPENKAEPIIEKAEIKATGNNLIDWTSIFSLGIKELDEQHQQLITLANQVYTAFRQDKTKKETKELIKNLIDFASYHFGNEEQYFEQFGFNEAAAHTKEHNEFLDELQKFQEDFNKNKVKFLDDIMSFIKKWLYHHFTVTDPKYTSLFKSKGL